MTKAVRVITMQRPNVAGYLSVVIYHAVSFLLQLWRLVRFFGDALLRSKQMVSLSVRVQELPYYPAQDKRRGLSKAQPTSA